MFGQTLFTDDFSDITNGNNTSTSGSSTALSSRTGWKSLSSVYQAGGAIKLGGKSSTGSLTTSNSYNTKGKTCHVKLKVKGWSTVEGHIKVSPSIGEAQTKSYTAVMSGAFQELDFVFTDGGESTNYTIATTAKRAFIDDVNIYTELSYEITAVANNDELGTVSVDEGTITATPKSGNRVISGTGGYTVTAGTASVTNNGDNTFTVTPSSDCTVQINFEAIPSHSVIGVASPVAGGSVEAADASVREGETTTLTATPNAGYKFTGWAVTGTGASLSSTSDNPTTLTIGTGDATVTASFEVATTYPIHWSVNGVIVKTDNVVENSPVTFAAPESGVPAGYVFKGWVVEANKIDAPTDSDPSANYVTSANGTAEITYYAVLAHEIDNTTKEKVTITIETENVPTSYGDANTFTEYSLDGVKFKVQQMYINSNRLQWRAAGNSNGTGTMYNTEALSNIQSIVLTYYGDDNKNFTVKVGDAENPTSGTSVEPSASGDVYTFDCSSLGKSYFVMTNGSGAGYLASVVINYLGGEIITFGYCTTVPTATINLAAACTDGDKCYGTYSNSKAFIVPADLTVYEVSVIGGELYMEEYATDEVVPANTGVLVAGTAGDHDVMLTTGGTSKLGANNMLRATGAGIDAAAMDAADTGCKFYRLTMHKGTQIGFFWGAENGAAFDVAANKAYLAVPNAEAGAVKGFRFGENTDAIIEIMRNGENEKMSAIYDLSGRRVMKPTKGLYIVNGKKVVK